MDVWSYCQTTMLIGLTLCAIYLLGKLRYFIFYSNGIPGPKPDPFLGNIRVLARKGYLNAMRDWLQTYGNVFGIYLGAKSFMIVADLDIVKKITTSNFGEFTDRGVLSDMGYGKIKEGLLMADGEIWRRQRRIVAPTFNTTKLGLMEGIIKECADTLVKKLLAMNGHDILVREYFGQYSLNIIIKTTFGVHSDSVEEIYHHCENLRPNKFLSAISFIFPAIIPLMNAVGIQNVPRDSYNFLLNLFNDVIHARRSEGEKESKDFLQLLLDAQDYQTDNTINTGKKYLKNLSDDEVIGQMFTILIGGYETTSSTLAALAYSLATNPHVQEEVVQEIHRELQEDQPTFENISKLTYLDQVISEVLRLYPLIYYIDRRASQTVTINNVTFQKGQCILIPMYHIHRDPTIFPDPDTFNPDRWATKSNLHPMAYLPFGTGPRQCIGMKLSMSELKVATVKILRDIKLCMATSTPDMLELKAKVFLSPKKPISLKIVKRQQDDE